MVKVYFTCNLVGVLCARSLHYQFYAWYAWQAVFLAVKAKVHWTAKVRALYDNWLSANRSRLALLAVIEYCWNVYPSTQASSLALLACHAALLRLTYSAS